MIVNDFALATSYRKRFFKTVAAAMRIVSNLESATVFLK